MAAQELLWAGSALALLVAMLCWAAERRLDLHHFLGVPWPLLMILAVLVGIGLRDGRVFQHFVPLPPHDGGHARVEAWRAP